MSAENNYTAEVMVCGGSKFSNAESVNQYASDTCGRIRPLDPNPQWVIEIMPDPRISTDLIITANGQVKTCSRVGIANKGVELLT